jgi:hypothetical protein
VTSHRVALDRVLRVAAPSRPTTATELPAAIAWTEDEGLKLSQAARAFSVPACVTIVTLFVVHPPKWMTLSKPAVVEAPKVAPATAAVKKQKPLPNIIAVDRRIARRVNALRPCVKQRLVRVARRLPRKMTLLVTSAARTRQEQASLRPTFGIKARPGTSTHEDGRAIDVNVIVNGVRLRPRMNAKVIGPLMASEGFRSLGRRDPVHYSIPKEAIDPTLTKGPDLDLMTMREYQEVQAQAETGEEVATADLPAAAEQP